ncbi:molybdopterin-dependent oxidoreductase [Iamia sp. SCSIO 61187]|uniref:xanthine dehydrogenase family protein molybdopterin-binding subunit n=1 Tax=Iamia sp. SCSIO 61187 TaxID=2722752 RepID=UPI001C635979|nr:molybdopterin cofactor-binding domain-containing protein [Iamia sp. SCSIO 61187]QYG91035.1 molybdopterin-dependent oxidoreductase [Iamia sp. SCSIO 61187]
MTRPGAVGTAATRPDVVAKLAGRFPFSGDISATGELYGATVRSRLPHARVRAIDAGAARRRPDVVAVITADDVPGSALIGHIEVDQPVLAGDVVRYQGEPIAFVVATTQEGAWAAAAAVTIDLEALPVVDDPERALDPGVPHLRAGGNLFRRLHIQRGDGPLDAPVVVEGTWWTGRQDQAFLGPESALAVPDDDGGVTLHLATQDLHADQAQIASALGLPVARVRLQMGGIGGAFGGREDVTFQVHLCLAALRTGRPVRITYRRSESFLAHPKRHPARLAYRIGAERDGTLRFVEARIRLDGGAYASTSGPIVGSAGYFAAGPYRVPTVDVLAESVATNNPVSGAMRGFGAVQACFGVESTMDRLAAALDLDPVELRRRNVLVPGDAFPTSGQTVGSSAPLHELIDRCTALPLPPSAAAAFDPADPLAAPGGVGRTSLGAELRRGVGFALGVKNHLYGEGVAEHAEATVVIDAEGVEVRSAASEVGQGITSALAQLAADAVGPLPVRVATAHTDHGYAGSSSASRATWMSGGAVRRAAMAAAGQLRGRAAAHLGVAADEVDIAPDGVGTAERRCALATLVGADPIVATRTYRAPRTEQGDPSGQGDVHVSWMFVAHRAVVDVDPELGLTRVVQVATAQDVGRAVNPREVRGQVDGGIAQGLGLALMEDLTCTGGVVENASFADYLIPTAADVAPTEVVLVEVPDPDGPVGLKGVGEPPSLSSTPAIAAALRHASGREVVRVPARPQDLVTSRSLTPRSDGF